MQDPNNPKDEEFLDGEFDQEFDEFDSFGDLPDDGAGFDAGSDQGFDPMLEDDSSFEDAGWDDFDDAQDNEAGAIKPTRSGKGLSFNTIVIGIAIVVGLGVLAYQVLSTPAPGGASRFQSVLDFTGSTDGPVLGQQTSDQSAFDQAPDTQGADDGFLNNPDLLSGPAPVDPSDPALDGGLPMPSPISNDIDDLGMEQEAALASSSGDVLTPMPDLSFTQSQGVPRGPDALAADPAPEESSPALDVIRRAQTQQQQVQDDNTAQSTVPEPTAEEAPVEAGQPDPVPAPAVAEAVPVPVSSPANAAAQAAQQEMLARLDALSARLGVMEQQIIQLRESGQTDLEGLEKEITALKSGMNAVANAAAKPVQAAPAAKKSAPKVEAAPKKKKDAPRPAASVAPSSVSGTAWELRAAQPGRAWVSRQGAREMESVVPGDTLSGIGQILRIDYAGGRWTVVGTQGQIRQ